MKLLIVLILLGLILGFGTLLKIGLFSLFAIFSLPVMAVILVIVLWWATT